MPDIKTAFTNALAKTTAAWDDEEAKTEVVHVSTAPAKAPQMFQKTNGVSEAVFNAVHDNPGIDRKRITDMLVAKGFKRTSVESLVAQRILVGDFTVDEHGCVRSKLARYMPIKLHDIKEQRAKRDRAAKKAAKPVKPVKTAPEPVKAAPALKPTSIEYLLTSLNVREAQMLYAELKKIFG